MTPSEIRSAVCTLRAQGHSLREISRLLALSRNTVRPASAGGQHCRGATV
jgi:DNA-binding NarL/FixJ family response regulator